MNAACWADPLSRKERRELAARLARAGRRFYSTQKAIGAAIEMSDLHLDVTERAEVATS